MSKKKDPIAQALGRRGGKARMGKLTKAERRELAIRAISIRWARERAKGKKGAK